MSQLDLSGVLVYLLIAIGTAIGVWLYFVLVCRRQLFASATSWFFVLQVLFWVGTVLAVDLGRNEDVIWLVAVGSGLVSFALGASAANSHYKFRPEKEIAYFRRRPCRFDVNRANYSVFILGTVVASIVVGVLFARAVGYNVLQIATQDLYGGSSIDRAAYSQLRTSISKDEYVAAGYASQFTAVLLPVAVYLIYLRARATRRAQDALLLVIVGLIDLYFLTITGRRGWVLHALLAFVLLMGRKTGPFGRSFKLSGRSRWASMAGLLIFYSVVTVLMGRAGGTGVGLVTSIVDDVYNRIIGLHAEGHVVIMRQLITEGPVWGADWFQSMLTLVPRKKEVSFFSELHAIVYNGNDRGSIGLTVWGSFLYNFGLLGVVVLSFVLGIALQAFTVRYVRGSRSVVRLVLLFVAGYHLATFRDPYSLFLDGFVTIMLFYGLILVMKRSQSTRMMTVVLPKMPASEGHPPSRGVADLPVR